MKMLSIEDITSDKYMYSTAPENEYFKFYSYLFCSEDIAKLFTLQSDGSATVFRTRKRTHQEIRFTGKILTDKAVEQLCVTPETHLSFLQQLVVDQAKELAKMNALDMEVTSLKERVAALKSELKECQRDDVSLKGELHYKVATLGYSAKDVLNEMFRENGLAGSAK